MHYATRTWAEASPLPPLAKSVKKFNPNMQAFKRVLGLISNLEQGRTKEVEQFNFFTWFPNLNNLVVSNDFKTYEMSSKRR